ncbi:hypothetical protein BAUCODRAFT_147712 [Baudoinia panamericana UAMH 10762]|uniref:DNA/RNA-binding protein Alba-like domain-containing protein n=1 Tax=Baudoinia panamericana (strain UAMH 10762) TaxID=717646 RepID=M2N149_BAUPA|nr:uncharacterized protein BAUCODRAFT_147712 [Baudoinia panamericana UAMH 10762]EMC97663.1 hypothetical protein BAUCODRAFT_147712 [Baudoinia panamericana UAMH 10762]
MAADQALLETKYEFVKLSVRQSTKISDRTAAIISRLTAESPDGGKPSIISLTAPSKASSKLISIVEIAKRALASAGLKCYQYNALSSQVIDVLREPKKTARTANNPAGVEEGEPESDDAFETMGALLGDTKKRNVPVLTIHLSRTPIKELRAQFGEQRA